MKKYLLFLFISGISVFRLDAQSLGKIITDKNASPDIPFSVKQYTTDDGLPQNQILEIIQTRKRELIIATANGIMKFNGNEFYPFINNQEYNQYFFLKLISANNDRELYGASNSGVFMLKPRFKLIRSYKQSCFPDKQTVIGITDNGIVFKENLNTGSREWMLNTPIKHASFLYLSGNLLFIATYDTTLIYDTRSRKLIHTVPDNFRNICKNQYTGELFACGSQDVYSVNRQQVQALHLNKIPDSECNFNDVNFLSATQLIISSYCGLFYYEKGETTFQYTKIQSLPTNSITKLYIDTVENCLFAGTGDRGLLKIQLKDIHSIYKTSDPKKNAAISFCSIITTPDKQILAGSSDGTVYLVKKNSLDPYLTLNRMDLASLSYSNNRIYSGMWGHGLLITQNKQLISEIMPPILKGNTVFATFHDQKGQSWVGSENGISFGKNDASIHPIFPHEITESITCLYELKDGTICAGGNQHVFLIKRNKIIRVIGKADGMQCRNVRAFYEDASGKLWIGTYNGGLYCFHKNKLTSINKMPNCTLGNDIFTLAKDGYGNLIMSSNHGIWMVNEKKLNDFYTNKIDFLVPFFFGEEAGIYNTEFNGGFQNNFAKTDPYTFYFPCIQGLVKFHSNKIKFRKLIPVISSVKADDSLITHQNVQLPRTTKTLRFKFYATSFLAKYNVYYQYRLISKRSSIKKWNAPQKENSVSLLMLPPGKYTLQVRALDGFNDPNSEIYSYHFTILPYFYETNWFFFLVASAIIGLFILIVRLRMNHVRQKARKKYKLKSTMLELRLEAIHSKMNPHFIFNALNNIIYLLNFEKYQEAENLLQDFSLLLRKFLENSDLTFNEVKSELEIIRLYLAIEQRRFDNRFRFEIVVDPEAENAQIPTMLLQPFIENAIKHGIAHLEKPGEIIIRVEHQVRDRNRFIYIRIEDNGIGREKSMEINKSRVNHLSRGIALVKEKIALVRRQNGHAITLSITDLNKNDQSGTIVELFIPLYD